MEKIKYFVSFSYFNEEAARHDEGNTVVAVDDLVTDYESAAQLELAVQQAYEKALEELAQTSEPLLAANLRERKRYRVNARYFVRLPSAIEAINLVNQYV